MDTINQNDRTHNMWWGVICTSYFTIACKNVDIDDVIFLMRTLEHNLIYVHLWDSHNRAHKKPMHFTPAVSVEGTDDDMLSKGFHTQKSNPGSIFN